MYGLAKGERVQLYYLWANSLNNDEVFEQYYKSVSEYRRHKIDAFRFRKDQNLSLGASILLQHALRAYGLRERDMVYGKQAYGKPYFINAPHIHFNISHSEQLVIAAIGDTEVGCDVEKAGTMQLNIAEQFFSQNEYLYIMSQEGNNDKMRAFFRLWTLKESFIKLTGLGMELPLNAFQITFDGDKVGVNYQANWNDVRFNETVLEDYHITVCAKQLNNIHITNVTDIHSLV